MDVVGKSDPGPTGICDAYDTFKTATQKEVHNIFHSVSLQLPTMQVFILLLLLVLAVIESISILNLEMKDNGQQC